MLRRKKGDKRHKTTSKLNARMRNMLICSYCRKLNCEECTYIQQGDKCRLLNTLYVMDSENVYIPQEGSVIDG